ncbi:hypothetical protein R1flu_005307 [Riccia fluitans]|uniref:Uncharacterized protein n=1 Tax=Riccia fluitans TaxID=41844 RepID=A0ABD1YST3_9MARC
MKSLPFIIQELLKEDFASLESEPEQWTKDYWRRVLGKAVRSTGGMLFDTKFDLKMKTRNAIDRKFSQSKLGTNGYPMAQFTDLFMQNIAMVMIALFKPHHTMYMLAHQVAFLEAIAHQ